MVSRDEGVCDGRQQLITEKRLEVKKMMRDTTRDRNNLISAWTLLMATSNPNALDVLQRLIPVVQSLLSHVDELQIEIKDLKQKLEAK